MKIRNLFAMAVAATMTMTACSNDDNVIGTENPEILSGESTYAAFKIQLSQGANTKAITPEAGDENAILNEADVTNAGIYIFKWSSETTGVKEVMKDDITATATAGVSEIPVQAFMIASGKKHVIVVTNMNATLKAALRTAFNNGYTAFNEAVVNLGVATAYNISNLFLEENATPLITMTGEGDPVLAAGITETQAKEENNSNHVVIYVDRLPAKIDVALSTDNRATYLANMDVIPEIDGKATTVGNVNTFKYDARNMKVQENVMKSITGTFVNTPWCGETPWNDKPFDTQYTSKFAPAFSTTATTFPFNGKLMGSAADNASAAYREYVTYMPENSNKTAVKGNSSYVALQAAFTPEKGYYISGYTNDAANHNKVVVTLEAGTITAGGFSMYNYEHNFAFTQAGTAADAHSEANIIALAGIHAASVENALADIAKDNIKIANSTTVTGFDDSKTLIENKAVLSAATKAPTLWVKIDKTTNTDAKLEQLQITANYYSDLDANGVYEHNEGVDFGTLTCGVYNTVDGGLQCYYRVNIYDETLGLTNMMYYSVVRNYSYHMTISKIKSIGYPTEIDLIVKPEEPLNNNTFVQAHVVINKWTKKQMSNVEVGM